MVDPNMLWRSTGSLWRNVQPRAEALRGSQGEPGQNDTSQLKILVTLNKVAMYLY